MVLWGKGRLSCVCVRECNGLYMNNFILYLLCDHWLYENPEESSEGHIDFKLFIIICVP